MNPHDTTLGRAAREIAKTLPGGRSGFVSLFAWALDTAISHPEWAVAVLREHDAAVATNEGWSTEKAAQMKQLTDVLIQHYVSRYPISATNDPEAAP